MLGEVLKRIIEEFPLKDEERNNKPFKNDSTAAFMRGKASEELENIIQSYSYDLDNYVITFSPGQSQWNHRPWGGIRNEKVSTSFQNGFYVVYLFKTDRKGVYLSLNQGYTSIEKDKKIKDKIGELENKSSFLRNNISKIPNDFKNTEIDCKDDKREKTQAGNIISKFYTFSELDDEEMLLNDLYEVMEIYNELIPVYIKEFLGKEIEVEESTNDNNSTELNVWRIYPGSAADREKLWPKFKEMGYIGVGWFGEKDNRKDYNDFESPKELTKLLKDTYPEEHQGNPTSSALMIFDFRDSMNIGDYIVVSGGYNKVLGIGIIKSGYLSPNNSENPLFDDIFIHLRKVDWKILDEIELNKNKGGRFFQQQTLNKLKWKKWLEIEVEYSKEYKINLLNKLYEKFEREYLTQEKGIEHLNDYANNESFVKEYYNEINKNIEILNDVENPYIHKLLPINREFLTPTGFKTFTAFGYKKNQYPQLSLAIFNLIKDLINTTDSSEQKKIIKEFIKSPYSKGSQSGVISPVLHALNPDFLIINSKTIDSIKFLSKIMGNSMKINSQLSDYIENNNNLKVFLNQLIKKINNLSNFHQFDAFCHWLCEKTLAHYANGSIMPMNFIIKDNGVSIYPDVSIEPKNIFTDLLLDNKVFFQICGALNSNKHLMLTGAPGTGKTDLAIDISKTATSMEFTDDFILTTATSDWTTFDTIGGYMPDENGNLHFQEGKFLQAIKENNWLIIDEINRADIDKAFGQLFTILSGQDVELPFKNDKGITYKIKRIHKNNNYFDESTATYYVGNNWRIISTMNVYDKDYLFEMSYAFMRRFALVYINIPHLEDFNKLLNKWGRSLDEEIRNKILDLYKINNHREIGAAIFKDMIKYLESLIKLDMTENILEDAFISYILPQFEGLEDSKMEEVWKIVKSVFPENNNDLKKRFEDISAFTLKE